MHSKKNFLNRVETGHVRLKKGSKHFYTNLVLKALIVTKQLIRTCFVLATSLYFWGFP